MTIILPQNWSYYFLNLYSQVLVSEITYYNTEKLNLATEKIHCNLGGIRTHDLRVTSAQLDHLSYKATMGTARE